VPPRASCGTGTVTRTSRLSLVIDAQSVLAARSPGASRRAARLALAVGDAPRLSGQLEALLARRVSTRRATALKGYGALPSSGCEERTRRWTQIRDLEQLVQFVGHSGSLHGPSRVERAAVDSQTFAGGVSTREELGPRVEEFCDPPAQRVHRHGRRRRVVAWPRMTSSRRGDSNPRPHHYESTHRTSRAPTSAHASARIACKGPETDPTHPGARTPSLPS
jgi:hypothetical protein